jgi:hypothetical protein
MTQYPSTQKRMAHSEMTTTAQPPGTPHAVEDTAIKRSGRSRQTESKS